MKIEIEIPEEMKLYVECKNPEEILQRNASLIYPYILNQSISHGKAAEILGISKLDLIDIYAKMGFSYFDMIMDDLDEELETFKSLNITGVMIWL